MENGVIHGDIIGFLPDATLVIDRDGIVIAWNRAMEELTGVSADSMLGKGDYEYALPFYGERKPILANLVFMPEVEIERRYNSVEKIGDTLVVDIFIPSFGADGIYLWAKASPLYAPDGEIIGAIETIRDITDRKRAEEEIARSHQNLIEIINFLPDATLVIDRDGIVIAWNRAMEGLTGVSADSMLGKGDYEYALPFYGERKPILANLVFMPEVEIERRYNS
ncbi:PAS domain S-box protein, partial [Methanocalculus taiwanensis]|nr:PAS domain S-box protein [Methanocalculus taiwanensis]